VKLAQSICTSGSGAMPEQGTVHEPALVVEHVIVSIVPAGHVQQPLSNGSSSQLAAQV
jgi:hypothetical protein